MSSFWNKITSIFITLQPCKDAKKNENDTNDENVAKEKARYEAAIKAIEEGPMCKSSSTTSVPPNETITTTNPLSVVDKEKDQPGMNGQANGQVMNGGRKKSKKSRLNKKKKTKRRR